VHRFVFLFLNQGFKWEHYWPKRLSVNGHAHHGQCLYPKVVSKPKKTKYASVATGDTMHSNVVMGEGKSEIKLFRVCYLFFFVIVIGDGQSQGLIVDFQLLSGQYRGQDLGLP
jgi:hypothetical protein